MTTTTTTTVDLKRLGTKETAARIRNDVKNLQKHGLLPAGKFSVTMDRFAGGSSITIEVADVAAIMFNTARFAAELRDPRAYRYDEPRMTAEGARIMALLNKVASVYHHDASDISSDYFCVNFYLHVYAKGQENKERAAFDAAMAEAERAALLANIDEALPVVDESLLVAKVESLTVEVDAANEDEDDAEEDEVGPVPTVAALAAALRVVEDASSSDDDKHAAYDVIEHPGVNDDMIVAAYSALLA